MRPPWFLAVAVALGLGVCPASGGAQAPADVSRGTGLPPPGQTSAPPPAGSPPAQQPASGQGQQPVFRAGINFVRVDVIVTDRSGSPVDDLGPGDFEIVEEGQPQKIETFKLVRLDGGAAEAAKEVPQAIRSDFDEESEAARDDVRLFAVFLDDYHVRRGSSVAARDAIANFVATQLGPSDMIGLMYPLESLGSIRMTRDREAVARGIRQFTGRKFEYTPTNSFEEQYFQYPPEVVEKIRNQVSLSALRALITHMGSLKEGRKALILVSEGFTAMLPPQLRDANAAMPGSGNPNAYNPAAGIGDPNEDRAAWAAGLDLQQELRDVFDAANRNNVAIYPVDPRGLAGSEFDIDQRVAASTDAQYLSSTIDTLRVLADNTDGRAIVNSNDLSVGLKQIVRDSSAYYLLGYSSTLAPSDGKFHEIKVRVKRQGVQVRARNGYWALTAEETSRALAPPRPGPSKDVTDALASIAVPTRARVVRTWIGADRGEDGRTHVTFVWEPLPRVPGDRGGDGGPARVSVLAVGPDGEPYFRGRAAGVPAGAAPGSAGAAARGARVSFDIPPGTMQLRLSIEGEASQVLDSEVREVEVPDLNGDRVVLGTPEVFKARTLRELDALKTAPDPMPIASREFSRTERLLIRVPAYGPGGAPPALTARLLNRAGAPMSDLAVAAQPAAGAPGRLELSLAALAPGDYVIEIAAEGGPAKELIGIRVTG
ncbi:MAG: VWA domain-containing protein [Acidobacteria bacterium]|nr:VWA domain-containing protein [Acidobacteriota bacterium]